MLDAETKRRIDSCRDILVGKVPDPKSQVEQITIALIYKFMDDMDTQAESLGGDRTFFAGEFARYAWSQLLAPGVGGHQTIGLYSEAIARMNENPGIPSLFRDIFKNAYLPYRDPETLRAFLKEINTFTYDHSERLGDAFEYLLSVLGSQGDAGQFRTPRHIIDFIVRIVNPTASDRVLDPACGTAGFLISAYKHILEQNKTTRPGDKLTPDQRKRLVENFHGYDISPDMVRLSLANMYLHGFTQPKIHEYDTLTSEERWQESADVILANPPFMTPKGGIRPHRRFSVQATRSEVLFVDYIAEHLSPTGRAGVIVPEGIIFQSQTAYKQLRKMLVEKYLVAVVSLPAGVFQPYSGVKTSILIFDRALARRSDQIAFFKVENDGYGLGAQRREIDKNDLPETLGAIREYLNLGGDLEFLNRDSQEKNQAGSSLFNRDVQDKQDNRQEKKQAEKSLFDSDVQDGQDIQSESCASCTSLLKVLIDSGRALIVPKEKIAANGDYNLSGERYVESIIIVNKYPLVKLSELVRKFSGGTPSKEISSYWEGSIPWISPKDMKTQVIYDTEDHISKDAVQNSSTKIVESGTLLCVIRSGILKHTLPLAITGVPASFNQDIIALIPNTNKIDNWFLFWILKAKEKEILEKGIKPGVTVQSFHNNFFESYEIPLPPLEVQKEIVAEIEGYQKVIDGARAVLENYRPHIAIDPEWPILKLQEIANKITDGAHFTPTYVEKGVPFLRVTDLTESNASKKFIPREEHDELIKRCKPEIGDVLYSKNGTIGIAKVVDWDWEFSIFVSLCLIKPRNELVDSRYLEIFLNSDNAYSQATARSKSGTVTNLHLIVIKTIQIPLPSLGTQHAILAEIEAERALVNANRELITRMEQKIQKTLTRIWGEPENQE